MQYFQILECNSSLGTCCSDYGLVSVLDIARKFMELMQIIVPILLIIFSAYQFIRLMANPDEKNGLKKVYNKYIAAAIVFFLPVIVNAVLGMLPDSFEVASCWQEAKVSAEVVRSQRNTYISLTDKEASSIYNSSSDYEGGDGSSSSSSSSSVSSGTGEGSELGKKIVAYAKQFVGKQYLYGGSWNGELPYTPTDCSGFVQGVFKHFGINLQRDTGSQWNDTSKYTIVTDGTIKAGDLAMYSGHVAILTGNGNEVVHAQSRKTGVVISSDYKTCSKKSFKGIMRINGVN